ncbi:cytochrome P450 [Archangium sp.]|uniref:cytochrome P450 n=1 Tax=Archangium sp. TaxID=1872627 RepID=UPI00286D03ED|nr:cytochrome P450 [Archangium sp.]
MTYDFFAPEVVGDPHSLLRRLRTENPVYWSPQLHGWVLTRYADVLAATREARLAAPPTTGWLDRLPEEVKQQFQPARASLRLWAGLCGEQEHLDFQAALKKFFTPSTLERLRPGVQRLTDELIDAAWEGGGLEVVEGLARPLTARVIGELLGLPTETREPLSRWAADLRCFFQSADLEELHRGQRSLLELQECVRPVIAARRHEPREDLISALASRTEGFFAQEPEAVVANCALLLFAGHETTSHLISSGLRLLLSHPEQLALLRDKPELMPSAIEEMLRYEGASDAMARYSTAPLELGGHQFDAGQLFVLVYKAANHDPEVFAQPERFDITRQPNRHLAFGMGSYYCLGAALARLEAQVCLRTLLRRAPRLRPASEPPEWTPLPPLGRRLRSLPVTF